MLSDEWIQEKGGRECTFYNPVMQNEKHCQAIAHCIGAGDKALFAPVVVFSRSCELNIVSDKPVIYSDSLLEYINQYKEKVLTPEEVELIKVRLQGYNNPSYEARQRHVKRAKYAKRNNWW